MIKHHGGPITPNDVAIKLWSGRHAMVSFANPEQIELAAEVAQSFVLDNGAFSFWRSGIAVDWDAYRNFCDKWMRHPGCDWVVIPDVIDGSEQDNDQLIDWWLTGQKRPHLNALTNLFQSVPVWHLHESLGRLERLTHTFSRVALGSSGQYAQPCAPEWWVRIGEAMRVCCDDEGYPRIKLHGLRMLNPTIFSHVPLSSADSCHVARSIGIDSKWGGRYEPRSKSVRALVLADRVESHAAANRWSGSAGVQQNLTLLG